jgi:predicted small lipoprotein YifL
VNRVSSPFSSRWTIVLVTAAVLALAGCGRKGPLDLPPHPASTPTPTASATPTDTDAQQAAKPSLFDPSYGADAPPTAAKGTRKPFILDPLLTN